MSKQAELFALFCDDVRQEIGGTQSLIGVFQDIIALEEMPFTFPRLSVFFNLHLFDTDFDRIFVELRRDDTGALLTKIALNDVEELKKRLADDGANLAETGVKVNGTIECTPFVVNEPMTLSLSAQLADGRVIVSSSKLAFQLTKNI